MSNHIGCPKCSEFFPEVRIEVTQTFPWPGILGARGKVATQALKALENEELTTLRDLILQTKKLYFELLFNKIARSINAENRLIVERIIDGAIVLYKTNRTAQEDVLKAEVELQILEEEMLLLEGEHTSIKALLNALRNQPQNTPIPEPQEYYTPKIKLDYEILEEIALKKRSELHTIESLAQEQREMAKLARLEYFPDITVSGMYQINPHNKCDRAWGISVTFDVPLWASRREGRQAEEAEARALSQEYILTNTKAQIKGRIKEIIAQLSALEKRIELYEEGLLEKVAQTLAVNESQYRVGKGSFITVLDTRRQLQTTELEYARTRVAREILLAELERAEGVSLNDLKNTKEDHALQHILMSTSCNNNN